MTSLSKEKRFFVAGSSGYKSYRDDGDCIAYEEYERLEKMVSKLPADWNQDSSLETWFPYTHEAMEKLRRENAYLKDQLRSKSIEVVEALDAWKEKGFCDAYLAKRISDAARKKMAEHLTESEMLDADDTGRAVMITPERVEPSMIGTLIVIYRERLAAVGAVKDDGINARVIDVKVGGAELRQTINALRRLHELEAREIYHCNVCGGEVDLSNATKPTAKVGPGRPMNEQP